ncbi:MAG: hypothetical protein OXF56_00955 [Rhodobacteraceae bacterium]|nr:hypothetical protein [Paracoccaceae bacterium]
MRGRGCDSPIAFARRERVYLEAAVEAASTVGVTARFPRTGRSGRKIAISMVALS